MAKPDISAERLRELLNYDPQSGIFFWRNYMTSRAMKGSIAGCLNSDGYVCIGILGKLYVAHRLAFLYMLGTFPKEQVDHINGDRTDNQWTNLRDVSCATNLQNMRVAPITNLATRLLGVTLDKRTARWRARIRVNGKKLNIGTFPSPEAAHAAYVAAKRLYHAGGML